jgi:hypothetical protein
MGGSATSIGQGQESPPGKPEVRLSSSESWPAGQAGEYSADLRCKPVSMAHEQPAPAVVSRQRGSAFTRRALPLTVVLATAGLLEWVRLRPRTPSLIDDWYAITYSPGALHALLRGDYSSAPIDLTGRYRPAYSAVWNYAQWHLLGSPSLATAAAWGFVRVALFLVAAWLLAAWLAARQTNAGLSLVWLAPLAVAVTPAIAVDLTRHSPAEPMMVGGLIFGLALVGAGVRTLLNRPGVSKGGVAMIAVGYLVYLFGIYSKETSVGLLVFAPFFVKWLGPDVRARIRRSRRSRYVLGTTAVLLLSPLVQLGLHLALSVSGGRDPYPSTHFSLGKSILAAGVLPLVGAPGQLGTVLWIVGVPAAIGIAAIAVRKRDRDRWLLVGVLATGFVMSALALARGDTPSRYYIPWLIAVAAVAVQGLIRLQGRFQIIVALVVVGIAVSGTRNALAEWARTEQSGSTAVEMAKGVVQAGCPLYLANFDVERRVAIPRLLSFGRTWEFRKCPAGSPQAYVLTWQKRSLPTEFAARCRSGWQEIVVRNRVGTFACPSFVDGAYPDQDAASGTPLAAVVRLRLPEGLVDPATLFRPNSAAHSAGERNAG